MSRLEQINQMIEEYARDMAEDESIGAYHDGYDDGWKAACIHIMDTYLNKIGFITTPKSKEELERMYEAELPTAVCVGAISNYLYDQIDELKDESI